MKLLHILKSAPDERTRTLIDIISQGEEATEVRLYDDATDYRGLVDLMFENDKVITWW
jgi:sulfur transfer complex TusBCD TusB component (DsrH family)